MALTINEAVTLSTGLDVHDGVINVSGVLYGITLTTPAKIVKVSDLNDIANSITTATFTNNGQFEGAAANCITYDAGTNRLYVVFKSYATEDPNTQFRIATVNPADLTFTSAQYDSQTVVSSGSPAIVNDGTHLYVLTSASNSNAWILKVRISDGTLVGTLQITGTNHYRGHPLAYDSNTQKLFLGGTKISATKKCWVGWVATDLGSQDQLDLSTGVTENVGDDLTVIGDYFYVGMEQEATATGTLKKIKKDLSTVDDIPIGYSTGVDGQYYDGSVLWVASNGDTDGGGSQDGALVSVDPSTDAVTDYGSITGHTKINEIISAGAGKLALTTYTSPAEVLRVTPAAAAAAAAEVAHAGFRLPASVKQRQHRQTRPRGASRW